MSCVHGPTVDSGMKTLDVGTPLFQIEYEGRAVEHYSPIEHVLDVILP